jgi:4-hydroxyphenylpyruvate dioxygenase-like putative hemolysin
MPSPILESKSDEHSFVYSEIDHLKNAAQRAHLERAMAFSKECKRLRRESALTIMFAATALWRSRSSLRAAQAALAIRAPARRSNG